MWKEQVGVRRRVRSEREVVRKSFKNNMKKRWGLREKEERKKEMQISSGREEEGK